MNHPNRRTLVKGLLASGSGAVLSGCVTPPKHANLGSIYNQSAQRDELTRNPIIVIPGIMGSHLTDQASGEKVWGVFGGNRATRYNEELAHPMAEGVALSDLHDDTVSSGVLSQITVSLGARIQFKAYAQLLAALGAGGYRDQTLASENGVSYGNDHYTCFQFGYDWRRSCVENAKRLGEFIDEKRTYVEEQHLRRFGVKGEVKFDIVAHSMGGLVARYFQMYGTKPLPADGTMPTVTWAGAKQLDKVILVATPNAGSGNTVDLLVNGYKPDRLLGRFQSGLLGTMPANYELLPRHRHRYVVSRSGENLNILDPEVWIKNGWGLADPQQDETLQSMLPEVTSPAARRKIALDHLRKCLKNAAQFQAAMDRPAKLPEGASLYLFAGDTKPTDRLLTVSPNGEVAVTGHAPGDYSVTRASAMLDERPQGTTGPIQSPIDWTQITFIVGSHLRLTRDPTFTDNMLHMLLEQ